MSQLLLLPMLLKPCPHCVYPFQHSLCPRRKSFNRAPGADSPATRQREAPLSHGERGQNPLRARLALGQHTNGHGQQVGIDDQIGQRVEITH